MAPSKNPMKLSDCFCLVFFIYFLVGHLLQQEIWNGAITAGTVLSPTMSMEMSMGLAKSKGSGMR